MGYLDTLCTKNSGKDTLVPVVRELPADLETPVSAFLKLGKNPPSFLLESVERGEQLGRYSFIGTNPYLTLQTSGSRAVICQQNGTKEVTFHMSSEERDPLHLVQSLLARQRVSGVSGLPPFLGGAVGYLAYDAVRFFENIPCPSEDELQLPDSAFLFSDSLVVFDHVQHKMKIVSHVPGNTEDTASHREELAR